MFERYTDRARRVIVIAQDEARECQHNYLGTEHLLLGLLGAEGVAGQVLTGLGITRDQAHDDVLSIVGEGTSKPQGRIPFTPRAKKTLELALREALRLGCNYIGTEHILLGVVREGEGIACQVMQKTAPLDVIRKAVLDQLGVHAATEAAQSWVPRRTVQVPIPLGRDRAWLVVPEDITAEEGARLLTVIAAWVPPADDGGEAA